MNLNLFKNQYKTATSALDALTSSDFVKLYGGNTRSRRSGIKPIDNWLNFSRYDTYIGSITAYGYKDRGIVALAEERNFDCCGKIPLITGDDVTVYEMIFIPETGNSGKIEEDLFKELVIENGGFSDNEANICKKPQFGKNTAEKDWHVAAKEIGHHYTRNNNKKEIDANDLTNALKILDIFYKAVPVN